MCTDVASMVIVWARGFPWGRQQLSRSSGLPPCFDTISYKGLGVRIPKNGQRQADSARKTVIQSDIQADSMGKTVIQLNIGFEKSSVQADSAGRTVIQLNIGFVKSSAQADSAGRTVIQ